MKRLTNSIEHIPSDHFQRHIREDLRDGYLDAIDVAEAHEEVLEDDGLDSALRIEGGMESADDRTERYLNGEDITESEVTDDQLAAAFRHGMKLGRQTFH